MNLEKVKELIRILKSNDYKDIFGAIILFETMDYMQDLEDIGQMDIDYLEEIYQKYMDSPTISGLLNDELKELIDSEEE